MPLWVFKFKISKVVCFNSHSLNFYLQNIRGLVLKVFPPPEKFCESKVDTHFSMALCDHSHIFPGDYGNINSKLIWIGLIRKTIVWVRDIRVNYKLTKFKKNHTVSPIIVQVKKKKKRKVIYPLNEFYLMGLTIED